ncbi:extensin family protein [Pseudomonas songnenensis]|uniref:Extensin n=1 Tax=Pseudomonas songnenensis TaxID=1176259 RepID=A0ABX9UXB5_9PSED|nr:extensin family protein [Pseudomonas songnenensis]AWM61158.1 extensin [Stutzerimonas stutzeri]MCQ4300966.1 extensin family protein [Pseudomonas songnenensis]RMH98048.1 extensin [Pseudomonas songnenensis]
MTSGRFLLLLLLLLAGFVLAVRQQLIEIPPRWNPWAPLDIREPPNLLTPLKLRRLQQDRTLCEQALGTAPLRYVVVPDSTPEPGCPVENSVRVQGSDVRFNGPFLATCPLAAAYAMFELHGLQPAAQAVFGQPVVRIDHFGSFACRNIARSNRRSQHASANALDMAGFHLKDGTRITVARDWQGDGDKARFLRQVRDAACKAFNVTLGPEYNTAHHDHFHVDMGGFGMCR